MKKILLFSLVGMPFLGFSQITLNQVDNFENYTTANWTKSTTTLPNQNIITDGPAGLDDNFLRVQSDGGTTPSGKLVTFNNAQWKGNYITAGVTYISMDVRNSGTNIITLRLAFQNTAWSNNPKWSSINPIAVVPGQGWNTIIFPIDANSLTRLGHTNTYNGDFNNINELRILHDDAPGWDGDAIQAVLDIDNIQARNNNLAVVDLNYESPSVKISPNPSSDFINVTGVSEAVNFEVYDLFGRLIKKGVLPSENIIGIQDFVSGVYFLKLGTDKTLKFIKA